MRRLLAAFCLLLANATFVCAQDGVRKLLPVPDIPGYKTLKADLHMHTVFSDGQVWPTVRVAEAWRDDLDVIAITDHLEYQPHKEDVKPDPSRAYAIARSTAEQGGIILIPSAEITKTIDRHPVHLNALFVSDTNALNTPDLLEALRRARAQNAYVFLNHPGWQMPNLEARWWPEIEAAYQEKLFQGAELVNDQDVYPAAFPWFEEKKLAILCDSDAHDGIDPRATSGRLRPITLIFARTRDAQGVREALDARRTAAWFKDQLWGPEEQLRALAQAALTIENTELSVHMPATSRSTSFAVSLRVRNTSAIPFTLRVAGGAPWLSGTTSDLPGESVVAARANVSREAPAGLNRVELEVEVANAHVAPERNLRIRFPVSINVVK